MTKLPYTLQVVRAGEVTDTEHTRTFAEAMKMARVHLAPDVEVFILLDGNVAAILRQPSWRQVLHSQLARRSVDITDNNSASE